MARTKIIATLGPATADKAIIERLILLGVNVFRLNFSHGDHAFHEKLIKHVRGTAAKLKKPIALLQDISGPKIRVNPMEPIQLTESDFLYIWRKSSPKGAQNCISINYPKTLDGLSLGDQIFFADGTIRSSVENIDSDKVTVKILTGGKLTTGKGMNLPVGQINLSAITAKDKKDITFGVSQNIDLIALSFVQSADDIRQAYKLANEIRIFIETHSKRGTNGIQITCSFGISTFGEDSCSFEGLMAKTDKALYFAKNQGRNKVCTL